MPFTRGDLILKIAEEMQLSHSDDEKAVRFVFDTIGHALENGRRVEFRGFGVFDTKTTKTRIGRNPKTGETIKIPSKRLPCFRYGKILFKKVNTKT